MQTAPCHHKHTSPPLFSTHVYYRHFNLNTIIGSRNCCNKVFLSSFTDFKRESVLDGDEKLQASIDGISSIHIGTFRYKPSDPVVIASKGIRIVSPSAKTPSEKCVINIMKCEIVKLLCHFSDSKESSAIIIYVRQQCCDYIRETIEMASGN